MRGLWKWALACILSCCLAAGVFAAERPNVILIICDDLNTDVAGYDGHPQTQTPNITRLMDSGMSFKQAHCTIPICAPSRSSFLTGIYPHTSRNFGFDRWYENPVLDNSRTIFGHFKENGYHTAGTGKLMHHHLAREWDEFFQLADYGPFAYDGTENVAHPEVPSPMREFGSIDGSFGPLYDIEGVDFGDGIAYSWRTGPWNAVRDLKFETPLERDPTADERNAQWAVDRLTEWAADPGPEPFFLAVGFLRPHTPLIADQRFFEQFPLGSLELPVILEGDAEDTFFRQASGGGNRGTELYENLVASYATREEALKRFVQAYLACVASVDHLIGDILDVVDGSSLKDNTIIVLTSDHGWGNGEKDYLYKNSLWDESTRVPFIIRVPGMTQAGSETSFPVSQIDLFPTLIELCDLSTETRRNENGAPLDGHSLKPFLLDPSRSDWAGPDAVLTAVYNWGQSDPARQNYALRTRDWRYIRYHTGDEELYDQRTDPYEWNNLALDPAYAPDKRAFRRQLDARIGVEPLTNLGGEVLFEQDFEDETGFLTESNPMGFGIPIQTAANGTSSKGDLTVANQHGSRRLVSTSVEGKESAQIRFKVISGQSRWDLVFDLVVDRVTAPGSFSLVFYGGATDRITFQNTGPGNIVWTPDGGAEMAADFAFSPATEHRVKVSFDGSALSLAIDDQELLAGLDPVSSLNDLGLVIANTAAPEAPSFAFDNFLLARRYLDPLLWLREQGHALDADLMVHHGLAGYSLLETYAFGLDTAPAEERLPRLRSDPVGQRVEMEFAGGAPGVFYDLQVSPDLQFWELLSPAEASISSETGKTIFSHPFLETDPPLFMRLVLGLE